MPKFNFKNIPLDSIRDLNSWSLHQDLSDVEQTELLKSIEKFGILRPPVVQEVPGGFKLICGRKRVAATKNAHPKNDVFCRIIPATVQYDYLLKLILEDQRLSGPLSVIMRARFISLCNEFLPAETITEITTDNDISYTKSKRLLPFLSLELPIRDAIHHGNISEKTGFEFLKLNQEDRLFLTDLFKNLHLNSNKQKNLIEMSQIIIAQENLSFKKLFTQHFNNVLEIDEKINIPQTVNNLLRNLFEKSHPLTSSAEKEFTDRVKILKLPARCSVEHSPSFEKDSISLKIEFKDIDKLEAKRQELDLFLKNTL